MLTKIKGQVISFLPALRSRNYRFYFFGQGTSLIGTWFVIVAEQWLVYPILTNNPSMPGIIQFINGVPLAALVLFTGVIADRIDKRKMVTWCQVLFACSSLILFFLIFTHQIKIWHIMAIAFINAIVFAFESTARMSFMIDLVEKRDYPSALSLNSGIFNIARAIGPALAGFFIAAVGIAGAYVINAISYIAVIVSLIAMKVPPHKPNPQEKSFKEGFMEGFTYIKQNKLLFVLLALVFAFSALVFTIGIVLPSFAHDIFHVNSVGFGFLQSVTGLGAMIGAFSFSKIFEKTQNKFKLLYFLMGGVVLSIIGFALSPYFYVALIFQFISGLLASISLALLSTLVQMEVPQHLRGRIMSFYTFALFSGTPIGAIIMSALIAVLGVRMTTLFNAIGLGCIAFIILFPYRRKLHYYLMSKKKI